MLHHPFSDACYPPNWHCAVHTDETKKMLLTSIDQKKYCWVAFLKNCGNPLHLLYWATKAGRDKSKHNHIQNKVRHAVFVSGQPKVKLNRNFQSQFRNKLRKNRLGRNFSADLIIQQLYVLKQLL